MEVGGHLQEDEVEASTIELQMREDRDGGLFANYLGSL